jgi:glycosyltransferase involved in cell wall biosynthesis
MPKLSIISHFYNHPEKVERQLAYWNSWDPALLAQLEFIVVDDCSEDRPAIDAPNIDLKAFRVITDVPWNQGGSRNLGAYNASGEWAMFFDIDQQCNPGPLAAIVARLGTLDPMTMYHFKIKELIDVTVNEPLQYHPNTFLVNLAKFKLHARYDEDFSGHYGYEDLYLQRVWEGHGGSRVLFNDAEFFEDTGFGTSNLNRDLSRNNALAHDKLRTGCKTAPGILRFEWEQLDLPRARA